MDSIHYSINALDGYDRDLNAIISPRSDGKTTQVFAKLWKAFKADGSPSIVVRRQNVDITNEYLDNGIIDVIEKFAGPISASHRRIDSKGCASADVTIGKKVFIRVISLSQKLASLKALVLKDLAYIAFDEFIVNTRLKEKYVPEEAFKFKEMYTTYRRESARARLKCYFMGNPYSLYQPLLIDWGVDPAQLRKPGIVTGPNWAVERHFLSPELKALLISQNPFYQDEDDIYAKYAMDGLPINDESIIVRPTQPNGFSLSMILYTQKAFLMVYENPDPEGEFVYWIGKSDSIGSKRCAFCFDVGDLVNRTILVGLRERARLSRLRNAIRMRQVAFSSLECDYLTEEIYNAL